MAAMVGPSCTSSPRDADGTAPIVAASNDLTAAPPPQGQSSCDDANPCTQDIWDGTQCSHVYEPDGRTCSDGNVCNGEEVCNDHGVCKPGAPPDVDDQNECTWDTCIPERGITHVALLGNACTDDCGVAGSCSLAGQCGADPLEDGNACTTDSCHPTLGVVHENVPEGSTCDDGDVCNGINTCDAFGTCGAGTVPPNGTSCSDGNPCNGGETCIDARCIASAPPAAGAPCDDGNDCTETDACDGSALCIGAATPSGTSCDDGNPCTTGDVCDTGECAGVAASGTACGDGDACNGAEVCVLGTCLLGVPPPVDDGDPGTLDSCNPTTGQVKHTDCQPQDLTVVTTLADMVECLYTGPSAIQTGMTETIDPLRAGGIHGKVLDKNGVPLSGATVTLRRRTFDQGSGGSSTPQLVPSGYGSTLTRGDGAFDLALNGGTTMVLEYSRPGYLSAQRELFAESGVFVTAPDVVLTTLDPVVTTVDLDPSSTDIQVARGSVTNDDRGTRQVTLLFQPGTVAELKMPDGTTSALPAGEVHVRATEYTVGPRGPETMPGSLPPTSAYTYAVELGLDEAIAAGAASVAFDPPVVAYLENFIGFPTGANVPSGSYRPDAGMWQVEQNGVVVQVTGITAGVASLDIDDDPGADSDVELLALGIDLAERERIAQLYAPGQSLWRIPVSHFTPWDWNWQSGPPADAEFPDVSPVAENPQDDACSQAGSIIGCETRSLGEVFGVVGTPFSLHYQSERTPGYKVPIHVPVTGATLPASVRKIGLELHVAGQKQVFALPPDPNQSLDLFWDGKNGLGQPVQGPQIAEIGVGYVYKAKYGGTGGFGGGNCPGCLGGGSSGGPATGIPFAVNVLGSDIQLQQFHRFALHHYNAVYLGLGGLTLDVHHVYDPVGAVLHLGDGSKRSGDSLVTISTLAGGGTSAADGVSAKQAQLFSPRRIARGPDGSLYVGGGTQGNAAGKILKVDTNEVVSTVWSGSSGSVIGGLAVGPDGSVIFSNLQNHSVYRVPPGGGAAQVIAGTGAAGSSAVFGGPAASAQLWSPLGIAVSPTGNIFIADSGNARVLRIDPDGKVWRVAGQGYCPTQNTSAQCGDGGPAASAGLSKPEDVALGPDGTLYVADTGSQRVRAITPSGMIHRVAGLAAGVGANFTSDVISGVPAKSVQLLYPSTLAVAPDGGLYIGEPQRGTVRRVDPPLITLADETSNANGKIHTVVGTGVPGPFAGEGALAVGTSLPALTDILLDGDGSLLISDNDQLTNRVFRVRPAMPGLSLAKTTVISEDGAEIYVFDEERRHEKTVDSMTGRTLYMLEYDSAHLLSKVTDAEGRETTIVRDPGSSSVLIEGPFGHSTTLWLNDDGYAHTIESPDGETVHLTYSAPASGLLTSLVNPRGHETTFVYDENGRLVSDNAPDGGSKTLIANSNSPTQKSVSVVTALGRTTTYEVDTTDPKTRLRKVTGPDGLTTTSAQTKLATPIAGGPPPGQVTTTSPDGTTVVLKDGPDPRLGFQTPFAKEITTTTGGLTKTLTRSRTVAFSATDLTNVSSLVDQTTLNSSATWTSSYQKLQNGTATWTHSTPMGRQGTMTLDTGGRPVQMTAPGFATVNVEYLTSGPNKGRAWKLSQQSDGATRVTELAYDGAGNLTHITSPLGLVTQHQHDTLGRVTQTTTPDGRVFSFDYDANGNVTSVSPPGTGGFHEFSYDARDRVFLSSRPNVGPGLEVTAFGYSLDGESSLVTQPDGSEVELTFDDAGRVTALSAPSGATTFTYVTGSGPDKGKLSSVTSADDVEQTFLYAGALLTDVAWSGPVTGTVHYGHDSQFRTNAETLDGSTIARTWDLDGQPLTVGALTLAHDPTTGMFQGTSLGIVQDGITWNGFGEVATYSASAGSPLLSFTFARDNGGRLATVSESLLGGPTQDTSYTYDTAGRLTDVHEGGVLAAHYAYDVHGNRITTEYAGQSPITAAFDAQDRLLSYGATSFTHAITGERLTRTLAGQTTTYTYDNLGLLETVTLPGGTMVEYLYDASGRRIAKKIDGTFTQRFLFGDAFGPVALVSSSGAVLDRYVYATSPYVPDYLVRTSGPDAGTYRLVKDERGSVRLVVSTTTGAVAQQITYDAFGRVLTDTTPGFTPFGYAGGLLDLDTGFVRFGARDYDPETGRWTTQDPIGLQGGDTNLYAYVGGDPVNGIDPSGLAISGNPAMDSALGGGFLGTLGFETFARGISNYQNGILELSNEGTFNQGLKDIRQGICQMVAGGIELATSTGPMAMAAVGAAGAVASAASGIIKGTLNVVVRKVVNSNMPHAAERAVLRAGFGSIKEAREALQHFGAQIEKMGLPSAAIPDTAHVDRIIVPGFGQGGSVVYQLKDGVLKLKTVLESKVE